MRKQAATKILAANVRALIECVGSGAELARRTGVPQKTISRVVNGENAANLATLDDLTRGLGLQSWHLLVPCDVRALFVKASMGQLGTRMRLSFETEEEADKAFEFICEIGSMLEPEAR